MTAVEAVSPADYFGSLKMNVRLPDRGRHRLRFFCCSCSWRYERGQRHWLYEVPAGKYPLISFSHLDGRPFPDGAPYAVVLPFVLEPFKRHLFHEIGVELDCAWIGSELVSFQQWNRQEVEQIELDGWGDAR